MSRIISKRINLLLLLGLLALGGTTRSYAQSPIVLLDETVTTQFPDTVLFEAEIQSITPIEEVVLIYGTNGRSCQPGGSRQPVEFGGETAVTTNWVWELKRSGSLPPGAVVWWQWEVTDTAGNVLTTDRQERTIQDNRYVWQSVTTQGIEVNWIQGDAAFGRRLLGEAEHAVDRLSTNMGIPQPDSITLWVYPSSDDVQNALLNVPEWTGGVAFPEYGITVIGVGPEQFDWAQRIIPHELTHLVAGVRMFNCRGVRLPTWLEEGLARYSENNVTESELNQIEAALEDGRLPPLRSLASGFSAYGSSAGLSYTQSYRIVQFLIEEFGPEQMSALMTTMQGGVRIDEALQQVYGFDTDGLDARWRETTGYTATPTSEADALAAQATPTLVPTLALVNPVAGQATDTPPPPATSTPTPTITPTLTPTAVATETATLVAETAAAATPTVEDTAVTSSNWPWIAGGAGVLLAAAAFIFIKRRGS